MTFVMAFAATEISHLVVRPGSTPRAGHSTAWLNARAPDECRNKMNGVGKTPHAYMGISWEYHGNIMGISWEYHGHIMGISWAFPGHTSMSQLRYLGLSEHGGVHSPPVMAVLIGKVMMNQWIWRDPMFKQSQTNKNIICCDLLCQMGFTT